MIVWVLFVYFISAKDVDLRLLLKLQNVGELTEKFWQASETSGQLTQKDLLRYSAAAAVSSWLRRSFNVRSVRVATARDYVDAVMDEREAARLLSAFNADGHTATSKKESVPTEIADCLDLVYLRSGRELHVKPTRKPRFPLRPMPVAEDDSISVSAPIVADPNTQKQTYQLPANARVTGNPGIQVVWGPGTYGSSLTDLAFFFQAYNITSNLSRVSYPGFPGQPGGDNYGEGSLDTQYITAFAPDAATYVWNSNTSMSTEEGLGFGYAFLDWLLYLSGLDDAALPKVMSLSLGSLSFDSCTLMCTYLARMGKFTQKQCVAYMNTQRQICMYDSYKQLDRMNNEFMKLGLRGVTILAASGDGGSHWSFQQFPSDPIGQELNIIGCKYNWPTFPASSPYVTAVGGASYQGATVSQPTVWSRSGGGFSWHFSSPPYQQEAIANYLFQNQNQSSFPPPNSFNANGRAYPDVSALADNVPIVISGQTYLSGGTSASTPTFAGLITLINDARQQQGKKTLGFINPLLYRIAKQHPGEAFYDITQGNTATECSTGFNSAVGFDPTTGLGTPIYPGLLKYLLAAK